MVSSEHDITNPSLVYRLPGMEQVRVRKDITYKMIDDLDLKLDIYYPATHRIDTPLPAVIFIHGDGPGEKLKEIKDSPQYTGWGQLLAASGIIAITANHRSTERLHNVVGVANDINDLISYIHERGSAFQIDTERLGLWVCSAGGFYALRATLFETPTYIRCCAGYYVYSELQALHTTYYGQNDYNKQSGIPTFSDDDLSEFSAYTLLLRRTGEIAPLFIARAGLDSPELNDALDRFINEAFRQNVNLTVYNHPLGHHGFDLLDDAPRTHEIISATLAFFDTHLQG